MKNRTMYETVIDYMFVATTLLALMITGLVMRVFVGETLATIIAGTVAWLGTLKMYNELFY